MKNYYKRLASLEKALKRSNNIDFMNLWIMQINRLKHKKHLYEKRCQEKEENK